MSFSFKTQDNNNFINMVLQRIASPNHQLINGTAPTSLFFEIVDDHNKTSKKDSKQKISISIVNGDKKKIYKTVGSNTTLITELELHQIIDESSDRLFINKKTEVVSSRAADTTLSEYNTSRSTTGNIYLDTENLWQVTMPMTQFPKGGTTLEAVLTYGMDKVQLSEHESRKVADVNYKNMMMTHIDADTYSDLVNTPIQASIMVDSITDEISKSTIFHNGSELTYLSEDSTPDTTFSKLLGEVENVEQLTREQELARNSMMDKNLELEADLNKTTVRSNIINNIYDITNQNILNGQTQDQSVINAIKTQTKTINDQMQEAVKEKISQFDPENKKKIVGANIEFDTNALGLVDKETVDLLKPARGIKSKLEPTIISSETKTNLRQLVETSIDNSILSIQESLDKKDEFFQSEVASIYNSRHSNNYRDIKLPDGSTEPVSSTQKRTSIDDSLKEVQRYLQSGGTTNPELNEIINNLTSEKKQYIENLQKMKSSPTVIDGLVDDVFKFSSRDNTGSLTEFAGVLTNAIIEADDDGINTPESLEKIQKYQERLTGIAHIAAEDNNYSKYLDELLTEFANEKIPIKSEHVAKGVIDAAILDNMPKAQQMEYLKKSKNNPFRMIKHEQDVSNAESTIGSLSKFIAGSTAVAIGGIVSNFANSEKEEDNREDIYNIIRQNAQSDKKTTPQRINPLWATGLGIGSLALLHNVNNMSQADFNLKTTKITDFVKGMFDFTSTMGQRSGRENVQAIKGGINNIFSDLSEGLQKKQNNFLDQLSKGAKSYADNFDDSISMNMIGLGVVAAAAVVGLSAAGRSSGKINYESQEREKQNEYYKVLTGSNDAPQESKSQNQNFNIDDSLLYQDDNTNNLEITNKVPISNMKNFSDNFHRANRSQEREVAKQNREEEVENNQQDFYNSMNKNKNNFARIKNDLNNSHMRSSTRVR